MNQGVGHAVDRILQLPHPTCYASDRVVINVAMLQSGAVYNHKPESGWFSLDVRSLDGARVREVEDEVRKVLTIARRLGYTAHFGNAGSANLNVPLGQGSVAIGIGGNRGGQRGSADEWGDIPQMMRTAKFVVLLAATIGR